jgi:hypothetical protein
MLTMLCIFLQKLRESKYARGNMGKNKNAAINLVLKKLSTQLAF